MLDKQANFFKSLSEPVRLRILNLLYHKNHLCVCEIVNSLNETQSKISRHLRYLEKFNILKSERKEKWSYYSITENMLDNEVIKYVNEVIKNSDICKKDIESLYMCKTCNPKC